MIRLVAHQPYPVMKAASRALSAKVSCVTHSWNICLRSWGIEYWNLQAARNSAAPMTLLPLKITLKIIWCEVVQCLPHPFLILGKVRIWGAEHSRVEPLPHSFPNVHQVNKETTVNYRSKFLLYLLVSLVHIQRHILECPSNAIYPPRRLLGDPPTPLPLCKLLLNGARIDHVEPQRRLKSLSRSSLVSWHGLDMR